MKKGKTALAALIVASGILAAGCGQRGETWQADQSSIYVAKDMHVENAVVSTSDEANELYNQEEMAEFARAKIAEYLEESGAAPQGEGTQAPVTLRSSSVEGQTGTLVFSYASPEDFVKFAAATGDNTHTVTSLVVRTVSEEMGAGGFADAQSFRTPKDKAAASDEVAKNTDYIAVTVVGAATVFTEGKIAYVSGGPEEVQLTGSHSAVTSEGKHYIIFK